MPEQYKAPEQREVQRPKLMPSRREIARVLKSGPANKLRRQTLDLKKLNDLKNTPPPKEQVTTVVKLAENLKKRAATQARNKLRSELGKKRPNLLNMRFKLKDPSYKPQIQKGKLKLKLRGLGGAVNYKNKGGGFEVTIKKGPDKKTPVQAVVKAHVRVPGQKNTTLNVRYNHVQKKLSVNGVYQLKKAGKLLGKTAQLDVRGGMSVSREGTTYSAEGTYGHGRLQLGLRTEVTYDRRGRVAYFVGGGLTARF